jgi:hypothetical protein
MAGTYYGYAERNADSYTDWAEIGKYTTEMLDETVRVRQEKKDALDKATRDALKQIADTPVGADASARQSAIEMADIVSKNLLIQEKLMKSGRLDPKDYLIYNQNALDSIDLAFNANKAYQENYQKIMDGVAKEEMSGLTILNAAKAEQYGDWNKNGYMMSPNGTLMVGVKTEEEINGKKVSKLDKVTSVNAINGLLLNTIPHNRLEQKITNWVKTLGKNQIAAIEKAEYGKQGMVITREDIRNRKDLSADEKTFLFQFIEAEKIQIQSFLKDDMNMASILYDTKVTADNGLPYSPTDDPEEAKKDPSKILQVYNEKTRGYDFVISDAQKKELEKFTFNRMREQYNIIEKVDVGSQLSYPPSRIYGGGGVDKDAPPPVAAKEILSITKTNTKTGAKRLAGISQKLDNLRFEEANGIENVITDIGYNNDTGALEIKGYQVTGKESAGSAEDQNVVSYDEKGNKIETPKKVTKGKNVTARRNLVSQDGTPMNDLNSASLLSSVVTRIPNPYQPGAFFQDIAQAKDYYRRQYQAKLKGPKPIQFNQNGDIIQ